MTKKRKIEYRQLRAEPETQASEAEPQAPLEPQPQPDPRQPEPEVAPQPAPQPVVAEAPPSVEPVLDLPPRASSLTPRELAAVLRHTPVAGTPVIADPLEATASPPVPTQLAATLSQTQSQIPSEPEEDQSEVLLFRLGNERFAAALSAIDEAVDLPDLHTVPESPPDLLGVFELRGRLVPLYSAARALRVDAGDAVPVSAFILSHGSMRIGIAVDGLEDAVTLPAESLREAPDSEEGDGVLLGIAHVGPGVVTVVSASALARSCLQSAMVDQDESSAAPEAA